MPVPLRPPNVNDHLSWAFIACSLGYSCNLVFSFHYRNWKNLSLRFRKLHKLLGEYRHFTEPPKILNLFPSLTFTLFYVSYSLQKDLLWYLGHCYLQFQDLPELDNAKIQIYSESSLLNFYIEVQMPKVKVQGSNS